VNFHQGHHFPRAGTLTYDPSTDFNFPPDDPAYSLLVGDSLTPEQESQLARSRVVNHSIDPTVPRTTAKQETEDDDDGEVGADDENTIANTRSARPTDGLLSDQELSRLFLCGATLRSAYDEGQRACNSPVTTFGDRVGLPSSRRGFHEPEYTAYAHYWKPVLGIFHANPWLPSRTLTVLNCEDYIFVIDPPNETAVVRGFVGPHRTEDLQPALPKTSICGSDHISLCAELEWEAVA
jgi:RNA exonuclease NGL2